jgi:hypothetical protein
MNTVITKFPSISYSEALNLKEELHKKDTKNMNYLKDNKLQQEQSQQKSQNNINIKLKKKPSILFSIIQGPKLYA